MKYEPLSKVLHTVCALVTGVHKNVSIYYSMYANESYIFTCQGNDYIIGLVAPALGPNKYKKNLHGLHR